MDMGMYGFVSGHTTCLILFFRQWTIESPLAFYLAFVGVVLLGVVTELLTYLRRGRWSATRLGHGRLGTAATVFLFAVQTTLAYALMLIAMTYSVQLFLAVILGLAVGHAIFNVGAPVPASADPCCIENVGEPTKVTSTSSHTQPLLTTIDHSSVRTVLLGIDGMVYEACRASVTAALAAVEGVTSVQVDLEKKTAAVMGLASMSYADLVAAVREAGKEARLL